MENSAKSKKGSQNAFPGETKKKKGNALIWCISIILAFGFWLYASGTSDTVLEESFDLIKIEYDSSSIKTYNLVVQSISIDTVNVTIMGNQRDLKEIKNSDISAAISLDKITEPGEYERSVMITTPDNTTLVSQTVERVKIKVDRPSEKNFSISTDSIELVGWTLDSGCSFGVPSVSATKATVCGPTLELDTVDKVKVRTASIGKASDGQTVSAQIVLLDQYGDEITSKNLSVSINSDVLTVKLSVYMEKTVKLTAVGKHGFFDESNISVSPGEVVITGDPDVIKGISSIPVAEIDERTQLTDTSFTANISIPSGVDKMTLVSGEPVETAEVNVSVSEIEERTLQLLPENIIVYSTTNKKALDGVQISIRLASSASSSILDSITAADITASANATGASDGDSVTLVITVSSEMKDFIYVIGSYEVKVGTPPSVDETVAPGSSGDAVTEL